MMHASSSTVILDFNSRLLAETNGFLLSGVMCQRISTHVSVRRQTLLYSSAMLLFLFQLTSPQGDEQFATFLVASELPHFNSRLCKETNARQTYDYYLTRIFQLTSP